MEEKKQKQQDYFHRRVLNAYLQRLRARWEPGENINVKAGDSESLPLGALADGRAGVSLRCSADREGDERKQCARYHLHADWQVLGFDGSPPEVHSHKEIYQFESSCP